MAERADRGFVIEAGARQSREIAPSVRLPFRFRAKRTEPATPHVRARGFELARGRAHHGRLRDGARDATTPEFLHHGAARPTPLLQALGEIFRQACVVEHARRLITLEERGKVRFERRAIAAAPANQAAEVRAELLNRAVAAIEVAEGRGFELVRLERPGGAPPLVHPPRRSSFKTRRLTALSVSNTPAPERALASKSGTFIGLMSGRSSSTETTFGRSRLLYWMT